MGSLRHKLYAVDTFIWHLLDGVGSSPGAAQSQCAMRVSEELLDFVSKQVLTPASYHDVELFAESQRNQLDEVELALRDRHRELSLEEILDPREQANSQCTQTKEVFVCPDCGLSCNSHPQLVEHIVGKKNTQS